MRSGFSLLLTVCAACSALSIMAQGVGHTFLRRYNLPDIQTGLSLATTPEGGFVATGQHFNNGSYGECDVYVYRVDDCGNRLWFNLYGTTASEGGRSILPLSDGGFLVTGAHVELMAGGAGDGGQAVVMRLNAAGGVQWFKLYSGLNWAFEAREVSGGFVVVGNDGDHPVVVKLDDGGEVLWATTMNGMAEMALALDILPDGSIVFATNDVLSSHDLEVAKLDANGQPQWIRGYGAGYFPGTNQHIQWGCDLLLDGEGHIYAIAPTQDAGIGAKDIIVLKLDEDSGDIVWSRGFGSDADDSGRQLVKAGSGFGLVGSTVSYEALASDYPGLLTEDLVEENILLARFDEDGYVQWARIYGGAGRERGVGIQFDEAIGFTMSAFSESEVFGNEDGSMDPLFIRTDLDGSVGCQSVEVTLVSFPLPYVSSPMSLSEVSGADVVAAEEPVVVTPFSPLDEYQCEVCFNVPQCEPQLPGVCLGDSIHFENLSEIGLRCYQEWVLTGPGIANSLVVSADMEEQLSWMPSAPGEYTAILRSTCPDVPASDTASVFVSDVVTLTPDLSDYNGFNVSCAGGADGWIQAEATGGYVPEGEYAWTWNSPSGQTVPADSLSVGTFTGIVTDAAGCTDSITVELTEPPALTLGTQVVSDYGGYMVSCMDGADGMVQALPSGGVPGYGFEEVGGNWLVDTLYGATPGAFVVVIEDANGCLVTDSLVLTAPEPPTISLSSTLDSCGYDVGTITAACYGDIAPLQILWPESAEEVVELGVDLLRWEAVPGGEYAVGVIDGNGCITMDTVLVPLSEADSVAFTWSPAKVCFPGAEVTFEDQTEGAVMTRTWDFGDGLQRVVSSGSAGATMTTHEFRAPGLFEVTLQITNSVGCESADMEVIEILQGVQVFVPSAFTPNNDGVNDGFGPVLSGVSEFRWTVFDRWGHSVFQSSEPGWWWNGSPDNAGRSHMNELFTWRLEAQGQCNAVRVYQGQVQLIK